MPKHESCSKQPARINCCCAYHMHTSPHLTSLASSFNIYLHRSRRQILNQVLLCLPRLYLTPHNNNCKCPLPTPSCPSRSANATSPIDTAGARSEKVGEPRPAGVLEKVQQQRAATCDNAVHAALRQHHVYQVNLRRS
jgi:hypothetical protein